MILLLIVLLLLFILFLSIPLFYIFFIFGVEGDGIAGIFMFRGPLGVVHRMERVRRRCSFGIEWERLGGSCLACSCSLILQNLLLNEG